MQLDPETVRKLQELQQAPPNLGQLQRNLAKPARPAWMPLAIAGVVTLGGTVLGMTAIIMANSPQAQLTRQQEANAAIAMESAKNRGWTFCILSWDCPDNKPDAQSLPATAPISPVAAPSQPPVRVNWDDFWEGVFQHDRGSVETRVRAMRESDLPGKEEALAAFDRVSRKYSQPQGGNTDVWPGAKSS